jgi:hypothetical protein
VEGQRVFIAPSALSTSSEGEPSTCLADLIEPDVGQGNVLFEHRAVSGPKSELLAQQKGIVSKTEEVFKARVHGALTCF